MSRVIVHRIFVCAAAAALMASARPAAAQPPDQNQGGGNINITAGPAGGIEIDAQGVVNLKAITEQDRQLAHKRTQAEWAQGNRELNRLSPMRKISLKRLEQAVAAAIERGEKPTDEMLNLAGLTKLQYVFLFPDAQDIVIAGPAEGFTADPTGTRIIGMHTGRATLQLEDLVVMLRAFSPATKGVAVIGCSIDPTQQGLKELQNKIAEIRNQLSQRPSAQQTQNIGAALRDALGLQTVSVNGVSTKTRVARILVEADYRMKLIGIGLDKPPVKITSYVSAANPSAIAKNALKRWYFVPDYQCLRVTEDQAAMELVGESVKLVGADELVAADGTRQEAGPNDPASQRFVQSFTKAYPELAKRAPVYAELRNIIDMAVAAAFMQHKEFFAKAGWKMETFGDEKKFEVEKYHGAKQIASACNAVWKGNKLATPIGGGVRVEPKRAIESDNLLADEKGKLGQRRDGVSLKNLPKDQWWWD
jgi:hypothetical protein